ncbi:MAG: helix-turn-helix transcriptional regulator [Pseudomonadota bacterium]
MQASQIRAARSLVGIEQKDLAERVGIAVATLRRMERDDIGPDRSQAGVVRKVVAELESLGAVFLTENGNGPGVAHRKAPADG